MDAVRKDVRRLVNKELEAANKRFPQFASPHEGQNVVREELEEAERAIVPLKLYIETRMWNMVKANQTVPKDDFKAIREAAVNLAVEAIQVAAMAKKFEHGQRNNWSGAREDSHGEEKTVPEVETVTITMSRPVAEAVKTACEWYLRLHMGQFWDMADDLCMENFIPIWKTMCMRRTSSGRMLLTLPCIGGIPCGRKWKSCITVAFSLLQFRM